MLNFDVTMTDLLLATQCFIFAILLYKKSIDASCLLFFISLALAALFGAIVHGFIPDASSISYAILWRLTLLTVGLLAVSVWYIGCKFLTNRRLAKFIRNLALIQFAIFSIIIVFFIQEFAVAGLNYLAPSLFLLAVFTREYLNTKKRKMLCGVVGMLMTFAASYVQIGQLSLEAYHLNFNTLYHLIQFCALFLLFVATKYDIFRNRSLA